MFGVTLLLRHPFRQPIRLGKFITVFSCRHKSHLCGGYISYELFRLHTGWRASSPVPLAGAAPYGQPADPRRNPLAPMGAT
jgi:hypothetical protein